MIPNRTISPSARSIMTAAASILPLLAAPSFSAQFTLLVVDTGGTPGTLGHHITTTSGAFYRTPVATTPQGLPPSRELVAQYPLAEFSSYLAMGGAPVSTSEAANPAANIIGPQFDGVISGASGGATLVHGVRFNFPITVIDPVANPFGASPTHSVAGPLGPDTVFLARLTVQRGERPIAPEIVLGVSFNHLTLANQGKQQPAMVRAELDGPAEIFDPVKTPIASTALLVKSHLAAQVTIPGWGDADVYDLYAVSESNPPKAVTVKKTAKPKPVKKSKTPKPIQSRTITMIGDPFPDSSSIRYAPLGSTTPTTQSAPTSPLVRQIMTTMGFQ